MRDQLLDRDHLVRAAVRGDLRPFARASDSRALSSAGTEPLASGAGLDRPADAFFVMPPPATAFLVAAVLPVVVVAGACAADLFRTAAFLTGALDAAAFFVAGTCLAGTRLAGTSWDLLAGAFEGADLLAGVLPAGALLAGAFTAALAASAFAAAFFAGCLPDGAAVLSAMSFLAVGVRAGLASRGPETWARLRGGFARRTSAATVSARGWPDTYAIPGRASGATTRRNVAQREIPRHHDASTSFPSTAAKANAMGCTVNGML